jgi:hydrogenase nickel incorporation protein HypB
MEIKVVRKVLEANGAMAEKNRKLFDEKSVFVLNMMSSPGSGKTTILEKSLSYLLPEINSAVIVGDICTSNDAERLARSGTPAVQVNTDVFGGDCHLAAHVVEGAVEKFDLDFIDLLIVENVGNLVCPAEFDIGEDARAVVLSVTEGEDKPLKYPVIFSKCDAAILNKTDLLPHLTYNKAEVLGNMLQVHPDMPIFEMSAARETGLTAWIDWLKSAVNSKKELQQRRCRQQCGTNSDLF